VTALEAYNEAAFAYATAYNAVNSIASAWASVGGVGESVISGSGIVTQPSQNKQQKMFQLFYGYWKSRTLFNIQTPWAVFQNMAIESFRAIQDESTSVITDYEVTFKLIRFSNTTTVAPLVQVTVGDPQTLTANLAAAPISLGDNSSVQGQLLAQNAPTITIPTTTGAPSIPFPGIAGVR
jgi:hypothetical protein